MLLDSYAYKNVHPTAVVSPRPKGNNFRENMSANDVLMIGSICPTEESGQNETVTVADAAYGLIRL